MAVRILTHHPYAILNAEPNRLKRAYDFCDAFIAAHSRSFYFASRLLPADKRRAVRALYAFCRVTDDMVDNPGENVEQALAQWRRAALASQAPSDNPVLLAWIDTRQRYDIPLQYAEELIDGVIRDLHQTRYKTFEDLKTYAYSVASTVGLMSMHIIGFSGAEAIPYAIQLGIALQITNILRDVAEDYEAGRIYLPADELAQFGLSKSDLGAGVVTEQWRAFMRFQIERNRRLYQEAMPGIALLNRDGRFAIRSAARLYGGILSDIEKHDYDVFSRRAHLTPWQKFVHLFKGV